MRILIVEDNDIVLKLLKRNLEKDYVVDVCDNGGDVMLLAQTSQYDAILLDLNLPGVSGEVVCSRLRNQGIVSPIIILSGNGDVVSKVNLLNMGADDYVTKPFNMAELDARIKLALRHGSSDAPTGKLRIDTLELDPAKRQVLRDGNVINLRKKEYDLLEYLMRNQGRALTRTMILEHIWEDSNNLWANVVDVHIKHLRDKIDKNPSQKLIKTVHGVGYKIEADAVATKD